MLSIWRISWRNIIEKKKRFALTLLSLVLGIAFVTSMLIADKTTNDVFNYYEQMYVANADYWILSDDYTFNEELLSSVRNDSSVTDMLMALDKQAFFELEGDHSLNQRSVRLTGVDNQNSPLLKLPVIEGELDNTGVVLPKVIADLLDKRVGDTVRFADMGEATISAIVEYNQLLASPSDWDGAQSTSFRVMVPLHLLRDWTGMENDLSYVRLQTNGEDETFFQSLQTDFYQSNAYIQPVVADDRESNDIAGLYTFFYLVAGLAIFISGFIVFNMIYTSVLEREKEFAIMKSLGMKQYDVSKLIFIEMLLLASLGTAIGVPLGVGLGDVFMQTLLGVFEFDMVYTLNWQTPIIVATGIGLLFPIVFALFPIYRAGKTSILLTLKRGSGSNSFSSMYKIRAIIGTVLLGFIFIDHTISYLFLLVSVVLLFPFLLLGVSYLAKPLLQVLFSSAGLLAVKNVGQQLNRNANTSSIIAVGISVILLLGTAIEAAPQQYEQEIRKTFGGDVRVTSETPWTSEDIETMMSYDWVKEVAPLTIATPITWETSSGKSRQFSVLSVNEEGPSLFEDPSNPKLYEEIAGHQTVVLGERAFAEWDGEVGQSLSINTPNGLQEFKVIDVVQTSHASGYVAFMSEDVLKDLFGWENSFDLLLTVNGNISESVFRNELWSGFGGHLSKVETVEDEIESTTSALTGMNQLILVMLLIVIGLASVGTANTLIMNTLERTVEIGVMRALGYTKQQVKTVVLIEGLLIGIAGVLGGIVTAAMLIYVTSQSNQMQGFMDFHMPILYMIAAIIASMFLSLIAAWIASISASKADVLSSLKEE